LTEMLIFFHLFDICSVVEIFVHFANVLCFFIVNFEIFKLILIGCLDFFDVLEGTFHWIVGLRWGLMILM
jgi:hypothetical protein